MATINPTTLSWNAPTENVDGSPITDPLSYRLVVDGADFLDFPGTLNPDGSYSVATVDLGLPNGIFQMELKTFYEEAPELISDPSNSIVIGLGVTSPNPPTAFSAVS